jgi:YrbI family 3-deoxy-D-manno-octulosonate 8-phosphate phosphatase
MRKIAFIPVRCNSKGIPLKNIKIFYGKPLIYWALKAAEDAGKIDEIVVATDCREIEEVVQSFQFKKVSVYRRSEENAHDHSSTESVMLELIAHKDYPPESLLVLIQATSPFTRSVDIDKAIEQLLQEGADSLLSCVPFKRFIWNKTGNPVNYDYRNRPRRQDFDENYLENGAFYINRLKNIVEYQNRLSGQVSVYLMPEYTQLELDEESDWLIGEAVMAGYHSESIPSPHKIKMFLSDIDGVLTDGGMYYAESGDELKKFNTHDGMGFQMLKERGIITGLITGEQCKLNRRRFEKLGLDHFFEGEKNKYETVRKLCDESGVKLSEVAYIGDDINDLELLSSVGIAACPANAQETIRNIPGILVLKSHGGSGAVREFIHYLFKIK